MLQLIGTLGYGLLDALVTGQILSAVSPHGSMTVVVGVIVAAVIVIFVCGVGMKVFHIYEKWVVILIPRGRSFEMEVLRARNGP